MSDQPPIIRIPSSTAGVVEAEVAEGNGKRRIILTVPDTLTRVIVESAAEPSYTDSVLTFALMDNLPGIVMTVLSAYAEGGDR